MSLFNSIQPTTTQLLQATQNGIINNNNMALQTLQNVVMSNWNTVWNNPNFTPQQIFDQFGTDAGTLFSLGVAACTFIETIQPGSLDTKYLSAALPYIINSDNTVTVTSGS